MRKEPTAFERIAYPLAIVFTVFGFGAIYFSCSMQRDYRRAEAAMIKSSDEMGDVLDLSTETLRKVSEELRSMEKEDVGLQEYANRKK